MTTTPAPGTEITEPVFVAGLDALVPRTPGQPTAATEPPANDRRINRLRATSQEKRANREHDLELAARRKELARQDRAARRQQRRADRVAARAERKARRADQLAQHAELIARTRTLAASAGRRLLVVGPILAPMAVAWSSQTSYAMTAFGWPLVFALGFAAAWELSTTFTAWMYHQARKSGDRGPEYRILTWIFALGAAAMNYAHHAGPAGAPTQASIAFSAMSITGMVLWEAYARLVHRQWLRDQGLVPRARPRLGLVRWIRYPVHAFTAWSLAIRSADHDTADKAWTAADRVLADRRAIRSARTADRRTARSIAKADRTAARTGLAVHRLVVPRVRTADHGPAAIPTVHLTVDRPDRTGPAGSDRTALPDRAPADRTAKAIEPAPGPAAAPADRTDRTAGPDRTATPTRPTTTPDRTDTGADRTEELVLTDLETEAITRLRTADRSISKRSIQDMVRNELNGSIASDRAVQIARHYRTLRSAA